MGRIGVGLMCIVYMWILMPEMEVSFKKLK